MKASELRQKTVEELNQELENNLKDQFVSYAACNRSASEAS
jgi:ribosomal protein L29